MAYKKEFTTAAGFTGDYWRVVKAEINKVNGVVDIDVYLYKDKASRDEGKSQFAHKTFTVPLSSINTANDIFEECYKVIKNKKDNTVSLNPNGVAFFTNAEVV